MEDKDKIKMLEQKLAKLEQSNADADFKAQAVTMTGHMGFANQYRNQDELDVSELLSILWKKKVKIGITAVVFAVLSVIFALSLPDIYKSSALLMPNNQEQSSSPLGGLAGQFGGLASLAGIDLGGGSTDKTAYALEVIKSREFLYKFIKDNNLKLAVMAADGWDRSTDSLLYNPDIYDIASKKWVRDVSAPFQPEPSMHETYEMFLEENLQVSQDKESGMVTIAVNHYSPYLAKTLVEKLVKAINDTVKVQDLDEATKSIQYLEQELEDTKDVGMQTLFYQLIEQQQQTLMLAKVRTDYVLKIVDRAVVPELKAKPKRAVIVVLGTLLGAILSSLLVLFVSFKVRK